MACRQLAVGVHQSNMLDCRATNETLVSVFHDCKTLEVQMARYFVRLLSAPFDRPRGFPNWCTLDPYRLVWYDKENSTGLFDDLDTGKVDVYPFEVAISKTKNIDRFYIPTPLSISRYSFYVNAAFLQHSNSTSPLTFLTSPFTTHVWLCLICVALVWIVLCRVIGQCPQLTTSERVAYICIFVPMFTMSAPYCSLLKALVVEPAVAPPFTTLRGLSDLIKKGKMRVILESEYSRRHVLLTNPDFARSAKLQSVYEALTMRPDALTVAEDMAGVCRLMRDNPDQYVFLGYREIAYTSCTRMCFWEYVLVEDAEQVFSFLISRKTPAIHQLAQLFHHAAVQYQQIVVNREYVAICPRRTKSSTMLIDPASLSTPFGLLGITYATAALCLAGEIVIGRFKQHS